MRLRDIFSPGYTFEDPGSGDPFGDDAPLSSYTVPAPGMGSTHANGNHTLAATSTSKPQNNEVAPAAKHVAELTQQKTVATHSILKDADFWSRPITLITLFLIMCVLACGVYVLIMRFYDYYIEKKGGQQQPARGSDEKPEDGEGER